MALYRLKAYNFNRYDREEVAIFSDKRKMDNWLRKVLSKPNTKVVVESNERPTLGGKKHWRKLKEYISIPQEGVKIRFLGEYAKTI